MLENIWGTHRISQEVRTDSEPAFRQSVERGLRALGVDSVHSSEYFPQGNGMGERAVKEVKKYLQKVGSRSQVTEVDVQHQQPEVTN